MSLPPPRLNDRRAGSVASQHGEWFSICLKWAAVSGSLATPAVPMSSPVSGVPNAKYCSQEVMNVAGITVAPGVSGRLALVPLLQLNSLPSEYPPGYRCWPCGSTGPFQIFLTTAICAEVRQLLVSVAEQFTELTLNFRSQS